MKTASSFKNDTGEQVVLTLSEETMSDLKRLAEFNRISLENLIHSYIGAGMERDSLEINRLKFTDTANKVLEQNNMPPRTFREIFDTLVL